jgi:hypothetical protein
MRQSINNIISRLATIKEVISICEHNITTPETGTDIDQLALVLYRQYDNRDHVQTCFMDECLISKRIPVLSNL